jgi:hypothetical protein
LLEQLKWLSYLWINSAQSGCLFRSLSSHEVIAGGRLLHGIEKKYFLAANSKQSPESGNSWQAAGNYLKK